MQTTVLSEKEKYVTYKRVSSSQQGSKGTSFEIQDQMMTRFLYQRHGDNYEIVKTFKEIQTGTKAKRRQQVYAAIELCRRTGATLLVSKLDRFCRDVEFLQRVFKKDIKFLACDFPSLGDPSLNRLVLTIMAAIAEYEAALIKDRIKRGVEKHILKYKKWGQKLVGVTKEGQYINGTNASREARKRRMLEHPNNVKALDCVRGKVPLGWTWQEISNYLNRRDYRTTLGREWSPQTVWQLYKKRDEYDAWQKRQEELEAMEALYANAPEPPVIIEQLTEMISNDYIKPYGLQPWETVDGINERDEL